MVDALRITHAQTVNRKRLTIHYSTLSSHFIRYTRLKRMQRNRLQQPCNKSCLHEGDNVPFLF